MKTEAQRFWEKVDDSQLGPAGCWLWTASLYGGGYGHFWAASRGRYMPAHVWSFEDRDGSVPLGLQLDHLCRNRACVNPSHLEAVTGSENCLRGETGKHGSHLTGLANHNGKKTCCPKGHRYEKNRRRCRTCRLEGKRRYYAVERLDPERMAHRKALACAARARKKHLGHARTQ